MASYPVGLCTVGISGARNAEAGSNVGVRAKAQRGNNILCVCGANVDLYIQLSAWCATKRRKTSGDQCPW